MIARYAARLGALPAGCLVGGLCGAVIGIDIEIFEPVPPIFVAFSASFIGYGVLVARFTDHHYPPRSVLADSDAGWTVARA